MADKESEVFNTNGDRLKIPGSSIKPATKLERGTVKQGAGVAKMQWSTSQSLNLLEYAPNRIIESLRQSGAIANDKFIIVYDMNLTDEQYEDESYGGSVWDENIYEQGDTAEVYFEDPMEHKDTPYLNGYKFKGWARTPNAVTPDFPYDENDPQTYNVTFTNDDIILYAVWEEKSVTVTYALGAYGTGSVPAAQTVAEGDEVEVAFNQLPNVNDGSGRVFVGWRTTDGGSDYGDATYKVGDSIYPYEDVTLYPVFCAQFTLRYELGNDASGSLPSSQTVYDGQMVFIDFMTHPTCLSNPSRNWIGWNTVDEQSTATYSPMGQTGTVIRNNVTLYPAYEASYVLTYSLGNYATGAQSLPSSQTGTPYMGTYGVQYTLDFSIYPTCTRAGTWNFIGWSTSDGQTSNPTYPATGSSTATITPAANLTLYPVFEEQGGGGGGTGTLSVVNNSSQTVTVWHQGGKDPVNDLTVSSNSSDSFTFDDKTTYYVQVSGKNYNELVSFTGTYGGQGYTNQSLSHDYSDNSYIDSPVGVQAWNPTTGDGGTITVSDYSGS